MSAPMPADLPELMDRQAELTDLRHDGQVLCAFPSAKRPRETTWDLARAQVYQKKS